MKGRTLRMVVSPYSFSGSGCIYACCFVSLVWHVGALVGLDLPQDWLESPR